MATKVLASGDQVLIVSIEPNRRFVNDTYVCTALTNHGVIGQVWSHFMDTFTKEV